MKKRHVMSVGDEKWIVEINVPTADVTVTDPSGNKRFCGNGLLHVASALVLALAERDNAYKPIEAIRRKLIEIKQDADQRKELKADQRKELIDNG